ncbi:hypothetical protein RhiirA4_451908 [Rhizophagus irregularis]|uniref:Uncharacterized protein n=1 Tax=Rhizophagus irregularis TaxID=588596 RepID=A0A2I1FWS5_9GLOM|nr:hypothetical protein RhiirA4_451908 [Rhizophagus irregularis]
MSTTFQPSSLFCLVSFSSDYSLTSSEIPYDNYCYYPITSDLSTISDVSISSISNALSDNNNSSEIPYDNHR